MNPVIKDDRPDPFVLADGGQYYLYSTSDGTRRYPYMTSADLVTWTRAMDAMPRPPVWSNGNYWAPEVIKTSAGYVMYFTARATRIKRNDGASAQCVGRAVSDRPEGPFVDSGDEPMVCQEKLGGTIDASPFQDEDGSRWLIYKNDGNCCSIPTEFFLRRLSDDGLAFDGAQMKIEGVTNDDEWEGHVVEAPTIYLHDDTYYLFYSANDYGSINYAVGYATSTKLEGPYVEAEENPILKTEGGIQPYGPGHQTLIVDDEGDLWMVYHAWDRNFFVRQVWMDELTFEGGKPIVQGPDAGPQAAP